MSRNSDRRSSLRVSLSNLMLRRSIELQDDPKYATLPQSHIEEIRPSILDRYRFTENIEQSRERYTTALSTPTTTDTNGEIFEHRISTINRAFKPKITNGLHWSIEPFLHYCASKLKLDSDKSGFRCRKSLKSSSTDTSDSHRAAFELLPPLFESTTHALLYQNSYFLDGLKYELNPKKNKKDPTADTKLRLNYLKFFKSVNAKRKPSDCEVIFGDASVICKPSPHWETSRIDWLLSLEKQQEKRKQEFEKSFSDKFVTTSGESLFDFYRREKQRHNKMKKLCKTCKKERKSIKIDDNASVLSIDGSKCTRYPNGNQKQFSKSINNNPEENSE